MEASSSGIEIADADARWPDRFAEIARRLRAALGQRALRIDHINQRYALLCRDYLRSHAAAGHAYAALKRNLARVVGDDAGAYYAVKDPAFEILMAGADKWAAATGWRPGRPDA